MNRIRTEEIDGAHDLEIGTGGIGGDRAANSVGTDAASAGSAAATAAPRGVAVCQACHAQNFMGASQAEGMTTPRLAGQSYEYLVDSMRKFAEGERTNNADMVQIMKGISAADRDAMAKYLSAL